MNRRRLLQTSALLPLAAALPVRAAQVPRGKAEHCIMLWLGGGAAPVAIAAMSDRYGMSASISAISVVYLLVGLLMVLGIRAFMPSKAASKVA